MTQDPFMRETIIKDARVVATLSAGGGAIVEQGDVEFREGRLATIMGMGERPGFPSCARIHLRVRQAGNACP